MTNSIADFIAGVVEKLRDIEENRSETWWKLALTGREEYQKLTVEWEMKFHALFHDREGFERVKAWRDSGIAEPKLKREIDLLFKSYLACQIDEKTAEAMATLEAELEGDYSNYRGEVDGQKVSENGIRQILKTSTESDYSKKAWLAAKGIGQLVREKVLKLVELRNGMARELGYRDYYAFSLELQEINEAELFGILSELDSLTREPFRELKDVVDKRLADKFGIAVDELRPWHYHDPFFQEAPPLTAISLDRFFENVDIEALTVETYKRVGMDIAPFLATSDLYEREGKNQHAFCLMVGRKKDVRILCNVKPNHNWMGTMLHEFGHGVYDWYLDRELPYLLIGTAHTNSTEAIAMLYGRLNSDPAWLTGVLGADAGEIDAMRDDIAAQRRLAQLTFVRWMLVMTGFERELYGNPNQDLNRLWWDFVEKYQMLTRPEDRDMPDYATKLHIALAPVYYHNYMLGEMTASQLQHYIEQTIGSGRPLITIPEGGAFLIDKLFRQGKIRPWNEALEFTTGEKLTPKYYVEQFVEGG